MSFHDEILAYDRARAAGGTVSDRGVSGRTGAAPSPGGKVVAVVSSEAITSAPGGGVAARLGLAVDDVVVVAVPGPRVLRPDGEIARAICLAAAWCGAREIVLVASEATPFRSPSFGVPGPAPSGESFSTVTDLLRHSAGQLRASAWLPRGAKVHGFVLTASGTLDSAVSGDAQVAADTISRPGPVSFFGAGPVANLMAAPDPIDQTPEWEPPSPVAGGPSVVAPPHGPLPSLGSSYSLGSSPSLGPSPSLGSLSGAVGAMPNIMPPPPPMAPGPLSVPSALVAPSALIAPSALVAPPKPVPPPAPVGPDSSSILNTQNPFGAHVPSILDTPVPETRPEARREQRSQPRADPRRDQRSESPSETRHDPRRNEPRRAPPPAEPPPLPRAPQPTANPPADAGDDPFERAEKILERLRRDRRK